MKIFISIVSCVLCLFVCNCSQSQTEVPNIVFVIIDDLGWNDLSYHNGSDFPTPNIDGLAANALHLDNFYTQHICSPTRSALMSGRYPIHTGLQHSVIKPTSPYGLPLDYTTLPQELKRAGYDTHMIGKWHLGFFEPRYLPTARGFDTYFGYLLGAEDYYFHNRSYDSVHGMDLRNDTTPIVMDDEYSTWMYANQTLRLLQRYRESQQSFFIYLSFQAVHTPLEAPQYVIDEFNQSIADISRRTLAAMLTVLDDSIGKIVEYLQDSNMWDNTLLIVQTDNGGPVESSNSNFPLRGSKTTLWEGGVKGIGFVTGGVLPAQRQGQSMDALMHVSDWLPTLCDIVGVQMSNQTLLDGYSQKENILVGVKDAYQPRSEILHNIDPVGCTLQVCGAIRINQYKLVVGHEVSDSNNLCETGWCPLADHNQNFTTVQCTASHGNYDFPQLNATNMSDICPYNGKPCVYDLSKDPCEYYDISQTQSDVYQMLYQRLLSYQSSMVTPLCLLHPENATAADPQKLDGFWGPWVNNSKDTRHMQTLKMATSIN